VIVVDASVLATALTDDGDTGLRVRRRLRGERLSAPELIDLEVTSVLRRLDVAGRIGADRARKALSDLRAVRVFRVAARGVRPRCWQLRHNLTVYDAVYVALAEALDAPLLTADGHLARSPTVRCPVELLS